MKKTLCVCIAVLAALFVFAFCVSAETVAGGQCGENVYWEFDDGGTLTIFGNGPMDDYGEGWVQDGDDGFYDYFYAPWDDADLLPDIETIVVDYGVTTIGSNAFWPCPYLTNVSIPDSVVSIGDYAFAGCSSLPEISIPGSVEYIGINVFSGCDSLSYMELPFVGQSADARNENGMLGYYFGLGTVDMFPMNTYDDYDEYFNDYDDKLNAIAIPGYTLQFASYWDEPASEEDLVIDTYYYVPECLTGVAITAPAYTIPERAFDGCNNLEHVWIDSVITIEDNAFDGCSSLTDVTILSEDLESIGGFAFLDCVSLTDLWIPESVTYIGEGILSGCESLTHLSVPFLGESADADYGKLGYFFLETGFGLSPIEYYDDEADYYNDLAENLANCPCDGYTLQFGFVNTIDYGEVVFEEYTYYLIPNSLESVELLTQTTQIAAQAFVDCAELRTIIIPPTVTRIGFCAFAGCCNLEDVFYYEYYYGIEQEWSEIDIEDGNDELLNATLNINAIYDSEGEILPENVTLSSYVVTYNGKQRSPRVTVTNDFGDILEEGYDYVVYVPDGRTVPGEYIYTVCGIGDYIGEVELVFTIDRCPLTASNVALSSSSVEYNGKQRSPKVTVKSPWGVTLTEGTHYTVTVPEGRTIPGTYTYVIKGKGRFAGTVNKTFTIKSCTLTAANVALSSSSVEYNGKQRSPKVTVTSPWGVTLTEGTHYTVTVPSGRTVPGTYTYVIKGKGRFAGTVNKTFTIKSCTLTASNVTLSSSSVVYNGKQRTPTLTVTSPWGVKLTEGTHYTVTVPSGRKTPGTYTYVIKGKGRFAGTVNKTFTITACSLSLANVELSSTSVVYNGKQRSPSVTVTSPWGETLTQGVDYTVTVPSGRVNPGSYTYKITGKGCYTGTVNEVFIIDRQPLTASRVTLSSSSVVYNGKQRNPSVTVKNAAGETLTEGVDYTVVIPEGRTAVGSYTYKITGKGKYSGTVEKIFTIKRA